MIKPLFRAARAAKFPALAATLLVSVTTTGLAQIPADQISPKALKQIGKILKVKHSLTPEEQKISSNIGLASRQARFLPIGGTDKIIDRTNVNSDGLATVVITGKAKKLDALITENGGTVVDTYRDKHVLTAKVPLTALPAIAASPLVTRITEPELWTTNAGVLTTQGYVSHQAKNVVEGLNVTGAGVKVGVLSDSARSAIVTQLKASGDLGPNTTVLNDGSTTSGVEDEGAAMMEIIQDLAPGAQIYFTTAEGGQQAFAAGIASLAAQGCTIIVDDISYFAEGVFQDGTVAAAVNTFVSNGGIYFSSAGNSGNKVDGTSGTWEGDFLSGGAAPTPISDGTSALVHNFGTAAAPVLYDTLTVASTAITLKWSDPLNTSTNDYDLFVLDSTGATVLASATTRQIGVGDPYEQVSGTFPIGARVVIVQYNNGATASATRALHLDTGRAGLAIATNGAVYGHNGGASTLSMAATFWNSAKQGTTPFTGAANPVELFSSDGPRRIFYTPTGTLIGTGTPLFGTASAGQILQKPDFTAADGVTCKTPLFSPFFGTSAAAPHAAGIVALMKSAKPTITSSQIRTILVSTAMDNEAAGFDPNGGLGVLNALTAVQAARNLP